MVPSRPARRLGAPRSFRFTVAVLALVALVALGPLAHAQAPGAPSRVDPVFVTATRSAQPLAELVADVTAIGADEIARSGAQSLSELLQRQPGVEITRNGGPGATSGVFLRGTNRGQTIVLVDGVRVASSTVGAASIEAIPLDQIDRIEILRGPASSLYGADAIGGVIQVFTRRGGSKLAADASAGYGTYATRSVSGGISGPVGPLAFAVSAGVARSRGFNAIDDPGNFSWNPDRDGYRRDNGSASLGWAIAPGHKVSAQYFRSRLDAQFDAGTGFDDRTITTLETWQVSSVDRFGERWTSTLSAGEGRDDSVSKTSFGESPFRTVQRQYGWQNLLAFDAGTLTLGLERREERVSGADFAVSARDTDSVYAIYRLDTGAHALQLNVRHDDSSQFGGRTTGAVAYGYRISPAWRVTAGASNAFKAPSFNDLYFPGFSNPDLRPETARNLEAGVYWTQASGELAWETRAVAWRNHVDDLIVFGCDANFVCRPDNVARARLAGVTLGADLAWRGTTLKGSLDLQSPEDDSGRLLPRRSRTHGAIALLQQVGAGTIGVEVVASGHRFDDAANRVPLAGYAIVNLTAEWPVGHGVALFARADNLFDRDYRIAAGYSTGGAQCFAGVRWRL